MAAVVTKNTDPTTVPTPDTGKTAFGTNLSSEVFIKDDTGAVTVITSGGTVTSVDIDSPGGTLNISGSPVTTSGTIDIDVDEAALDLAALGGDLDLASQVGSSVLPIANGGTGQTTAGAAFDALAPAQAGQSGKVLGTNGTTTSWVTASAGTVTSVSGTAPVVSSGGATPAISMPAATTSVDGYLTSADWNTFNSKGSGTVTNVSGTAPIVSSGGATPAISIPAASTSVDGYLTSTDWNTFNSKGSGSVTSVGASSANAAISVSGSPVTSSGSITLTSNAFTSSTPGHVPASGGGTTNFLRADGTFAAPPGGGGSPGGSNTQVQYNNSGSFAGSSAFTWDNSALKLTLSNMSIDAGAASTTPVLITGASDSTTATGFVISAGTDTTSGLDGGSITINPGTTTAGGVVISAPGASGGGKTAGTILLSTGTASSGASKNLGIQFETAGNSRLRINHDGDWTVGGSSGTAGQVLTSNGTGSPPGWTTVGAGTVTSVNMTVPSFLSVSGNPITTSGTLAVSLSGTALPVANGGTGVTTMNTNSVVLGNGTSAVQFVNTGASGNVLTSNGTTWVSAAPAGGGSVYYKDPVRLATTANGTLATAYENGDALDGVTLVTGDRILLKNQTTASENGIYTVNASGAPTRATDFDTSGAEVSNGVIIPVQFGTVNGGSTWQLVANGGAIGNSFRFAPVNGIAAHGQAAWTTPIASGTNAIAIGNSALASGTAGFSIAIGNGATASSSRGIAIGGTAQATTGQYTIAIGNSASATGTNAIAIGRNPVASLGAQIVLSSASSPVADFAGLFCASMGGLGGGGAKDGIGVFFFNYWYQTTNATPTELGLDASGSSTNTPSGRIVLLNDCSYIFDCDIVARNTATDTETAAFNLKFVIRRGATAADTAIVGTPVLTVLAQDTGTTTWTCGVTADTTNGRPNIQVTGEAAKTIRWNSTIKMDKVGG